MLLLFSYQKTFWRLFEFYSTKKEEVLNGFVRARIVLFLTHIYQLKHLFLSAWLKLQSASFSKKYNLEIISNPSESSISFGSFVVIRTFICQCFVDWIFPRYPAKKEWSHLHLWTITNYFLLLLLYIISMFSVGFHADSPSILL